MNSAHTTISVPVNPLFIQLTVAALITLSVGCLASPAPASHASTLKPLTIVSLDYCADQYTLKLAPNNAHLMLSSNATETFSYLKDKARTHPQQAARLEYILRSKPDFVVRSYGGGALISQRLRSLNIPVVQLQFSQNFEDVYSNILTVSSALGRIEQGQELIEQTRARLDDIQARTQEQAIKPLSQASPSLLYLTASAATAGQQTFVNSLMSRAGFENYIQREGWAPLSLEQLSLQQPQYIATAFFDPKQYLNFWSSIHHPVAKQLLASSPVTELNSATLACAAWYSVDSVEKLADARYGYE